MSSFLFFAVTAFFIAACDKDPDPEPDPDPVSTAFPFYKLNTKWTYDTYDSDSHGTVISTIYTITAMDAQGYATVTWTIGGFPVPTTEWYADNTKFSKLCSKATGKMLIYCTANPSVGDLWTETWATGTGDVTDSVKVVALSEAVTVPAGTFTDCIKLKETTSDDPVYYTFYWFSKTKGIVKSESTTQEDYPDILYQDLRTFE